MKKITFLLAILFLASFSFLSAQKIVSQNQDVTSCELGNFIPQPAPKATYVLKYINGNPGTAIGQKTQTGTRYYSGCINFTQGQMHNYVGGTLNQIEIALGTTANMTGLTGCRIWIKTALDGPIVYQQDVTFTPTSAYHFETYTLTTPYPITDAPLVIGYTVGFTTTATVDWYPLAVSLGTTDPYVLGGMNYTVSTSATLPGSGASWSQFTGQGNLAIKGYVDAPALPTNDLAATGLKSYPLKWAGNQTAYVVTVFNTGTASQNNYTVSLIDAANAVLATKTMTTALASGASTEITMNYTPTTVGNLVARGKVTLTGDEVAANDISDPVTFDIYPMQPMAYCDNSPINGVGWPTGTPQSAAIQYPTSDMGMYAGKQLTAIVVGFGEAASTLSNCSVWIRSSLTGSNLYSQTFTPTQNGWNKIILTTPYTLPSTDIYIGWTGSSTGNFIIGVTANTPNAQYGGNIQNGTNAWQTLMGQSTPMQYNCAIIGVVEGSCQSVTDLVANYNNDCQAVLTWTAPAGATKFNVYRGSELIAPNITTTTYTDVSADPTKGYTWSVMVVCSGGGESSPVLVTKGACLVPPAAVTNLAVTYNDNCDAQLTWTASVGATYYKVYRDNAVIEPGTVNTNYTDAGINALLGHSWDVVAGNTAGESAKKNVVKTACIVLPSPVTNLDVNFSDNCSEARLTWSPTTADVATGYNVYRGTELLGKVGLVAEPSFIDTTFAAGTNTWSVKILCKLDKESDPATKTNTCVVGIKNNVKATFSIVPNPANDYITITAKNDFNNIEVLSFLGQVVLSQSNIGNSAKLDISNFTNGVYFVRIASENGTIVKKFVKQ